MSDSAHTKNHPVVKALAAHQERVALADNPFARRYLRCSGASWGTLKAGTYPADPAKMIERCEGAMRTIEDEVGRHSPTSERAALIELSDQKAAIKAVRDCATEPRNRLVVFLADTGGGKTILTRRLREKYLDQAVIIEATETWRDNYFACCLSFADALNITEGVSTKRDAEAAVIDCLAVSPRILLVDEAHYCGKEALNLIKLVLNKTASRIVILSMPQLWAQLSKKSWYETLQLRNRTFAKVVMSGVSTEDCRAYLKARLPGFDGGAEIVTACKNAANRFGLFNTLQGICDEVERESADTLDAEAVTLAIERLESLRA